MHRLTVVDADDLSLSSSDTAAAEAEESNPFEEQEQEESLKPSSARHTLGIE